MKNYQVRLVPKQDPSYTKAYELVKGQYKHFYKADLPDTQVPYFFVYEQDSQILACMSCTPALENTPLFSEHYLSHSIIDYLPPEFPRKGLMEIGALASVGDPFATQQLIRGATMMTYFQYHWEYVLITANSEVARLLERFGVVFTTLEPAHEHKLPQHLQGYWGAYYQTEPAVRLIDTRKTLSQHLQKPFVEAPLDLAISGLRVS